MEPGEVIGSLTITFPEGRFGLQELFNVSPLLFDDRRDRFLREDLSVYELNKSQCRKGS